MAEQVKNKRLAKKLARIMFPREKWHKYCKCVYIAESRKPLEKELVMAKILANLGHCVYMLPEHFENNQKNPDAIMDGETIEFKDITGNRNTLGDKYRKALKQADNVFIKTKGMAHGTIYSKIVGNTKMILQNGGSINLKGKLYVFTDEILNCYYLKDIVEKSRDVQKHIPFGEPRASPKLN